MRHPVELLSLELPCNHHAPGIVRRALGEAGSECAPLEDAFLVASELVTNAVLHSGCADDHLIHVRARALSDGLLISVHDPGITGQEANPRRPTLTPGGWGLRIVDQLARRWGTERPDGYRVWAELARPS